MSQEFKPSKFQQAIYDWITNGSGNAVVNAVAGSGKTTTIVNALTLIPKDKKIIFLAFNKSIANELKDRVPEHVQVSTLHSLGFRTYMRKAKGVKTDDRKYKNLIRQMSFAWNLREMYQDENDINEYIDRINQLTQLGRLNLCSTPESLLDVANKHDIPILNGEILRSLEVIGAGSNDIYTVDFTDMLYMPIRKDANFDTFDWVFVDECQDLNPVQQAILKKILKPTSRFVAVGDPGQAIYGFAGADSESFKKLQAFSNTISLPLSCSYRCGTEIINLAKSIVPEIESPEGQYAGKISEIENDLSSISSGDFIICRNIKPLVTVCLKLIASNKKANILGADIGKTLSNLVIKSKKTTTEPFIKWYEEEINKTTAKLCQKQGYTLKEAKESRIIGTMEEKLEVFNLLIDENNCKQTSHLVKVIENIFSDEKGLIVLSTIHKAKGLEANRVLLLNEELMPSKYAKKPWELEQEKNLRYVAYTRAKKELVFLSYNTNKNQN